MKETSRRQTVDVFRLLAAFCVILLHLRFDQLPSDVGVGLRLLSRWAIPFFFLISGYFLAARQARSGQLVVMPTVYRLLWLFLLWVGIYMPFEAYFHDFFALFKALTAPTFLYFGLFSHLWFLPALMFGLLFASFAHVYRAKWLLPVFSIISLSLALLAGAYRLWRVGDQLQYDVARTWLSIPFLYVGMVYFQKGKPGILLSTLLAAGGAALQIFEAKFLYQQFGFSAYEHQFLIGTIPFALGMAGLALSDLRLPFSAPLSRWGGEYSLGVYLLHPALIFLLAPPLSRLLGSWLWQALSPLLILFAALAILSALRQCLPKLYRWLFGLHVDMRV